MTNHPRRIGKFEILERLGEDAMGEVFLARDTILGREVAIKLIPPSAFTAPEARERFFREAQAAGRLNHPNLAAIHEFGEDQGLYYLTTDFVPGEDLTEVLAARELEPKAMLELLAQVCDGLAFAHQRGVLHRDLQPCNIRVTRVAGRLTAKILDFGINRLGGLDLSPTAPRPAALAYLAPECLQSGKTDHRADLFAVGAILYEALAGASPFAGDTVAATLQRIAREDPPPVDPGHLGGISPAIQGILDKALAKAPAARFASGEAFAAALRAARDPLWTPGAGRDSKAHNPLSFDLPSRPGEPGGGSGRILTYLAVPVLLAAAALGGWRWYRHHHRTATQAVAKAPQVAPPQPVPAPQPQPVPAPQLQPVPAPAEPPKAAQAGPATLDEAAATLASDPKGALAFLDPLVQREPGNERALALRIVALYGSGDYKGCGKAMFEARTTGHPIWPLAIKYPQLQSMLEKERTDQRLPKRKAPAPAGAPEVPGATRPGP